MTLKVLISPCAFKGTLSACALAGAFSAGVADFDPGASIEVVPIADGGDGTIESIATAIGGVMHDVEALGPVDNQVRARWLEFDGTAVAELACVSGLALLPEGKLRPLESHTFGLGQVIADCLKIQPRRLFVCVGGSASTDGGAGALAALGAKFMDSERELIGLGNQALSSLVFCDLQNMRRITAEIKVAVDVTNPLLGLDGAARIFGPQKGGGPKDIEIMENNLRRFADVLESVCGRRVKECAGAGAAGGTAFGIATAFGAEMISGFQWLSQIVDLERRVINADLVLTGEGRLDSQSIAGKAIGELAKVCHKLAKPLWAVPALAQDNVDWTVHHLAQVVPVSVDGSIADVVAVRAAVRKALTQYWRS